MKYIYTLGYCLCFFLRRVYKVVVRYVSHCWQFTFFLIFSTFRFILGLFVWLKHLVGKISQSRHGITVASLLIMYATRIFFPYTPFPYQFVNSKYFILLLRAMAKHQQGQCTPSSSFVAELQNHLTYLCIINLYFLYLT